MSLRERIRRARAWMAVPVKDCDPAYQRWIALWINGGAFGAAVVGALQRWDHGLLPAVALMLLACAPFVSEITGRLPPWWVFQAWVLAPCVALMVLYPQPVDFVPFVLVISVGCAGAYVAPTRSFLAVVASIAVFAGVWQWSDGLTTPQFGIWSAAFVVGWELGVIMRAQQLNIDSQRRLGAERELKAATEERRRIAREIHDVVAHSLSVTMLHLTAARRDLEDGDGSREDIVDSLREAERVGRQAMQDVRATVGLLGTSSAVEPPVPTMADGEALFASFTAAGLDIEYDGPMSDPEGMTPATASCVFRVLQESLANVAKHASHPRAVVRLVSGETVELTVRSPLAGTVPRNPDGSGLRGMAQRAELVAGRLDAGPEGTDWVVRLSVPGTGPGHACAVSRLLTPAPSPA